MLICIKHVEYLQIADVDNIIYINIAKDTFLVNINQDNTLIFFSSGYINMRNNNTNIIR